MSEIDRSTECQIKCKAKELFFVHGNFNASTQEIADFAGVNRTLLNYYFRSKHNLFKIVYGEVIVEMKQSLSEIYVAKLLFKQKIDILIDYLLSFRFKYPHLELFNIMDAAKVNGNNSFLLQPSPIKELQGFLDEISNEMEKGTIHKSEPVIFIINIISLVSFPIVMRPIFSEIFQLNNEQYDAMLSERRAMIYQLIFNEPF